MIKAAKALRDTGAIPANVDNQKLNHMRHATVVLPKGADWVEETAELRTSEAGRAVAWEMKPLADTGIKEGQVAELPG